jgi:hypothetical protein
MSFYLTKNKKPTKSDFSSTDDIIGLSTFFDFLCAIFSRIAAEDDPLSLFLLSGVFRIIPHSILKALSNVSSLKQLENDDIILKSSKSEDIKTRNYKGKLYIDFIEYAKQINILIEDTLHSPYYKYKTDPNLKIFSIADSNYGDVLVMGIKYIPNFVFISYRGTYSSKSASSYLKLNSITPEEVNGMSVVSGIAKIQLEILHTVFQSAENIGHTFLKSKQKIIPVFTGQSLGAAMATLFTYEYCNHKMKGVHPDSMLSKQSVLVTFGSPRVLSIEDSEKLCNYAVKDKITLIHRYSNNADPITSLPPNKGGIQYSHPCSSLSDKKKGNRKFVARDCESPTNLLQQLDYTLPIHCVDDEPTITKQILNSGVNFLSHASYLYISFNHKSDFLTNLLGPTGSWSNEEIGRVQNSESKYDLSKGDTELRIVSMTGNNKLGLYFVYFMDLVKLRLRSGSNELPEDSRVTNKLFADILKAPHSRIYVKIDKKDKLPLSFPKSIKDSRLLDISYPKYQHYLLNTNKKMITKKAIKKNKKTRKNK